MSKHIDSGRRCLVYHGDGEPLCIVCDGCKEYLRPEQFRETECPGLKDEQKIMPLNSQHKIVDDGKE